MDALLTYVFRLADDNLILGQRLGALVAKMPELEEDIAVANLALDHVGQARNLYQYAAELDSSGRSEDDVSPRTEDDFAMLRDEREFLNAVLVEQPNGDFAHTMVRQFFVDAYQVPLYGALSHSADERLAAAGAEDYGSTQTRLAQTAHTVKVDLELPRDALPPYLRLAMEEAGEDALRLPAEIRIKLR